MLTTPVAARVTVRALARWCDGAPRMRVEVDHGLVGTRLVRSPLAATYRFAATIAPGAHVVRVTLVNPHRTRGCRRALRLGAVRLEPINAPATVPLVPLAPALEPALVATTGPPLVPAPTVAAIPTPQAGEPATTAPLAPHPPGVAPATAIPAPGAPAPPVSANPLAGRKLYIDPAAAAPGVPSAIAARPQA